MKIPVLLFFCLSLFFPVKGYVQEVKTNQFFANPLYYNPAFAGSLDKSRVFINTSFSGSKEHSLAITYDQVAQALRGGVSLLVYQNSRKLSPFDPLDPSYSRGAINYLLESNLHISLGYAPKFNIKDKITVSPGVRLGFVKKTHDYTNYLTFGDQIDPVLGFIYIKRDKLSHFDFEKTGISKSIIYLTQADVFDLLIEKIELFLYETCLMTHSILRKVFFS